MPDKSSSLYDDSDAPAAAPAESEGEENASSQTAILPKSLFGGRELKPGDKCDVEVVRVHEDAYEVQGCEGHDDEAPAAPAEEEPAQAPNPMME